MKTNPIAVKRASKRYANTFPMSESVITKKNVLTRKFENQFMAVAREEAVPTKCIGYISVLTLHTVEDILTEKNPR